MKTQIIIGLFSIFIFLGCDKPSPSDPTVYQPTQTGANILYCKIDGVEHVYKNKGSYLNDNGVDATPLQHPDGSMIIVISANEIKYDDAMTFYVSVPLDTAGDLQPQLNVAYKIDRNFYDRSIYIKSSYASGSKDTYEFDIDTALSFVKFSRYDKSVMSGTFYFEANYKDSLHVKATDGFFDISR